MIYIKWPRNINSSLITQIFNQIHVRPVYLDTHIHTSNNPSTPNEQYDLEALVSKIKQVSDDSDFLISITDHNMINKSVYLRAIELDLNIILGVEIHVQNYPDCPAYHCHIYFKLESIDESVIDDINSKLDDLYPKKVIEKSDPSIPTIQDIINCFDFYEFMLLPHGGQSHATFDTSVPDGTSFDGTLERNVYYNHFEGFTARGNSGLERTQSYFKKLGINEFVSLITCSDNYDPEAYPNGKDKQAFKPTWMLAEPTFEGLRLSLSEQSRLIYSESKPTFFSEIIEGVTHKQDSIEIDVSLTPGLNVVIGGSSSGKTLLVDSIVRVINKSVQESNYQQQYGIDKMIVINPSGMSPHYLSQNYIMSVVNDVSDDNIDRIDIVRRVFPDDEDVKTQINSGLREFKTSIQQLVRCVRTLEEEEKVLATIPVLSRLIGEAKLESNIFKGLQPNEKEKEQMHFSLSSYNDFSKSLAEISKYLELYPFVNHNTHHIEGLALELEQARSTSKKERKVRQILNDGYESYNKRLIQTDVEGQSKGQNFEKMLKSVKQYVFHYKKFFEVLDEISSYSIKFDSQKFESMGHILYIENDFVLNKEMFVRVVNKYLKIQISDFAKITPENFYDSTNFRKKSPKVHDYSDFESKIYTDFEKLNRRRYKIITSDGRDFEELSPGWKTSVILDLVLGYDKDLAPIIIDQPEDNLATDYINHGLVDAIKRIKTKKQVILVSHNATIPMLADAQNVVLCKNEKNKLIIKSGPLEGMIDEVSVVDHIASITDGGNLQ